MTRTYQDSGMVNYRGIQTFEYKTQNEPAKMLREISINDLIREEHSKGRTVEHLAKTYLMSTDEINNILGGEEMKKPGEEIRARINGYMLNNKKPHLELDDIRAIADIENKPSKTVAKIAGHMGVYTSPAKAKVKEFEPEEAPITEAEAKNLVFEVARAKEMETLTEESGTYLISGTIKETHEPETIFYSNMSCHSTTATLTMKGILPLLESLDQDVKFEIRITGIGR